MKTTPRTMERHCCGCRTTTGKAEEEGRCCADVVTSTTFEDFEAPFRVADGFVASPPPDLPESGIGVDDFSSTTEGGIGSVGKIDDFVVVPPQNEVEEDGGMEYER